MLDWIKKSFKRQVVFMLFSLILLVGTLSIVKLYTDEKEKLNSILESQVTQMSYRFALSISDNVFYNNYFKLSDDILNLYEYNQRYATKSGALFKILDIAVVDLNENILGHSRPIKNPIGTHYKNSLKNKEMRNISLSKIQWHEEHTLLHVKTPIYASDEIIAFLYIDIDPIFLLLQEKVLLKNISLLLLIFVVLLISFIFFFARWIDKPFHELIKKIDKVGEGKIEFYSILQRKDEFFTLAKAIKDADKRIYKQKEELLNIQKELEQKVKLRTQELQQKAQTLQESNKHLQATQKQLVETEKMSALGSLVAGVAHEINTPLGVSLTGASHIEAETKKIINNLQDNSLSKSTLESYLDVTLEMSSSMHISLRRASELVRSFKQVAIDQHTEDKREFNLYQYFQEIIISLHSKIKYTNITVHNDVNKNIHIHSYAGIYAQMITNFIMNSLIHAYEEEDFGTIYLTANMDDENLKIIYKDNGKGLEAKVKAKMFDPFFTTKMGQGGSGLGLNIIYNLVHHKLKGSIECESTLGKGMQLTILIPTRELK